MPRLLSLILMIGFAELFLLTSIANAAPPPSDAFGRLPAIYDAAISPDGSEIASIVNHKGKYVVSLVRMDELGTDNITPRLVALGDGVKPSYVKWVNDQHLIVSFWQSEKMRFTPFTTGYLYSLDTKSMKGKILIKPRDVFRQYNNVVADWLEDDPEHILMVFDEDSNNDRPDLRKVNVLTGRSSTERRGRSDIQYWYTDTTGEARIGKGRRDNKEAEEVMLIRKPGTDDWDKSDEYPGLDADTWIHGFTSNPNEVIISAYQGKDTLGLYVYDLSSKSITRKIFHDESFDASGVILSKDGDDIIGVKYTAEADETKLLDGYDTLLEKMRSRFEQYTVDYVDQTQSGDMILFKASSTFDPGYLMAISKGEEEPKILGRMYPELNNDDLGSVIAVNYTARDGQKIPSYVTLPPAITGASQLKNLPFIVLPHGGPYARDSKRFDYFAQFFASRGYGVLQMNFRGSEGYGKSYEEAGRKNWVIMQEDVEDGTRWLMEKGYADPERICIAGWSYGGYAALMGAAKNPDLYNCAISMAGVTDLKDLMRDFKKYRFGEASAKNFIANGFESKDDIKANSPVKIAEDMTVPIFMAHGTLDQRVHFDQYKRMKSALKKSKSKTTFMEFEDEDHFLSKQENRQKFFKGLDKFLVKHNGKSEFAK